MKRHPSSLAIFRSLNIIDLVTMTYLFITGIFILYNYSVLPGAASHLLVRLGIFLSIGLLVYSQTRSHRKWIEFIHWIYPLLLLAYLFKETAYMNHLFYHHYLDAWLVGAEEKIFGYLPAVVFSEKFPQVWLSELLNFGYFSYYFMTLGIATLFFFRYPEETERVIFIILTSFFIYYLFYIFFPTEGPVYFLRAPLSTQVRSGVFSHLVLLADRIGDGRTGAFPSSHVGMAVIYAILTFRRFPKLFWFVCALVILICFATVYIKAHYFLDVISGLLSAPLIFVLTNWLYNRFVTLRENPLEIAF